MARYLVCVTGASGSIYGLRLVAALVSAGAEVRLVATDWGRKVVREETGLSLEAHIAALGPERGAQIVVHEASDLAAPVSSGSFRLDGAAIVPCSMGTIGALASGLSANLVQRAGAVALKEGWPLVLVPRESPLSLVGLRGLVALREAGATIMPACPGFYNRPATIEDLVDEIVHRVLDRLGVLSPDARRWEDGGDERE
jgi:4-hydroxy-3-polyprenylbenzoate decarboxylase